MTKRTTKKKKTIKRKARPLSKAEIAAAEGIFLQGTRRNGDQREAMLHCAVEFDTVLRRMPAKAWNAAFPDKATRKAICDTHLKFWKTIQSLVKSEPSKMVVRGIETPVEFVPLGYHAQVYADLCKDTSPEMHGL